MVHAISPQATAKGTSREEWPAGYEKARTIRTSTVGRKTGKAHTTTIQFAVDLDRRFFVATKDRRRDWVKNARKHPSVTINIRNFARRVIVTKLASEAEKQHVVELYRKKYLMARIGGFFVRTRSPWYDAFELIPDEDSGKLSSS